MSKEMGVISVRVSLQEEQAVVALDPRVTTPDNICHVIESMGFIASVKGTPVYQIFNSFSFRLLSWGIVS